MEWIDTHAHIFLTEFENDIEAVIQRWSGVGGTSVLLPAIDSGTHHALMKMNSSQLKAMMGLHPCSVRSDYGEELAKVEQFHHEHRFIAVGEIGLDFYWDVSFKQQQYKVFEAQLALALDKDLPVSIHSRNATDECIEVTKRFSGLRGVYHCFSGNVEQARTIIDQGLYLGIGGVVTFKKSGLDAVIREVGIDNVVLETDAPYLAPVPFRGKRNEPSYIQYIGEALANITGKRLEEVAEITTRNARKVFGEV